MAAGARVVDRFGTERGFTARAGSVAPKAASERLRLGRVCRAARRVARRKAGRVWSVWPASAPPTRHALPTRAAEARSRRCTIGAVSGEGRGVGFSKAKFSKVSKGFPWAWHQVAGLGIKLLGMA